MKIKDLILRALELDPTLPTKLGMPPELAGVVAELADTLGDRFELGGRREFRRGLVLHLIHGREAEFDADPKAAALRVVQAARAVELELDKEDARDKRRQGLGVAPAARDLDALLSDLGFGAGGDELGPLGLDTLGGSDQQPLRREIAVPYPDLDCVIELPAGERRVARFGPQHKPCRVDGVNLMGPIELVAGVLVRSFKVAGDEQLAPADTEHAIPLEHVVGDVVLTLQACQLGGLIELELENTTDVARVLPLRLSGWLA